MSRVKEDPYYQNTLAPWRSQGEAFSNRPVCERSTVEVVKAERGRDP